jgi:hypothetical protein
MGAPAGVGLVAVGDARAAAATLVEVEKREHGSVSFSYYWTYCQVHAIAERASRPMK